MHEFAVCQSLLSQVEQVAHQNGADRVSRIVLEVGPLSGVVPELLNRAFQVARLGGIAARAELSIELSEIRVRCQRCDRESTVRANNLLCAHCGDYHVTLQSGDELMLKSVELQKTTNELARATMPGPC